MFNVTDFFYRPVDQFDDCGSLMEAANINYKDVCEALNTGRVVYDIHIEFTEEFLVSCLRNQIRKKHGCLDIEQIADIIGVTPGAASNIKKRALAKMKRALCVRSKSYNKTELVKSTS